MITSGYRHPLEDKERFILKAIEKGFSVKKVDNVENAYEFSLVLKNNNENDLKNKKLSRSVSLPQTKKEIICNLFLI